MVDDFGGTDSDQGTYGPVGPTSGSEPAPSSGQGAVGPAGPPGPTGPAGPSIDLWAATRIVSLDPDQGTDTTIQEAVDNLPEEGGVIFIKQGTYPLSAPIVLPDKSVVFRGAGWGTILDMGSGAFSMFTVPDTLTQVREYTFEYLWMKGTGIVGQVAVTVNNSLALGQINFCDAKITEIEVPVDVTAGDLTYSRPIWINFDYCSVFAPVGVSRGTFIRASSNGGAYLYGLVTTLNGVIADDNVFSGTTGWSFDADTDLRGSDNIFAFLESGSSTVAGFYLADSDLYCQTALIANRHTFTMNGLSWAGGAFMACERVLFSAFILFSDFRPCFIACCFQLTDLTMIGERGCLTDCIMIDNSKIFVGNGTGSLGARARIKGCVVQSTSDIGITIAAGADYAKIDGCHFRLQTTAGIQTAAQRTNVTGCTFEEAGGTLTVSEVGGANRTLGVGNNGVSSGGGLNITGANSKFVIGDYNLA